MYIAAGGALATAVSFGPARIGFGLFLPQLRETFELTTRESGYIASSAFGGFLIALLLAGYLSARFGPRLPVVLGSLAALAGMTIVALANNTLMLAAGTVLAATSAGCCWSPFNNAAERGIADDRRNRALSIISTGTTGGIAGAGLLALGVAWLYQEWRVAWGIFALMALLSTLVNFRALARLPDTPATRPVALPTQLRRLCRLRALPLYAIALSFGISSGIYLSFTVDHVMRAGGLPGLASELSGPVMYIAMGIGGIAGLATAEIHRRIGMTVLVRTLFILSAVSLLACGLAPTSWPLLLLSALLQGSCIMMLSAIFSFWSVRLFPELAAVSFTAVLVIYALGNIIGPAAAGSLAATLGMNIAFAITAALSLLTALLFRERIGRAA
ncbi:putative MFS family arabinose efflux permease [Kushneria sinocarnis]|uniref:Putative MFS family arabinose efflux permease n=2 Tax=Kushneria sinocarnis TaxID=595502 RepID=A0A420WSU6_9GAMM|nr:putative MFS family arabinose efflux permease [Kushneria sinocarnis]